ncbi:unnamed protein product [Rhodiola kirilowii]
MLALLFKRMECPSVRGQIHFGCITCHGNVQGHDIHQRAIWKPNCNFIREWNGTIQAMSHFTMV